MSASPRSARNASVRRRRLVAAVVSAWFIAGWGIVAPAGIANADCTGAGDFGAGSGCAPPGGSSGSGGGESWPPTAVDWPPSQSSDSDSGGGSDAGAGGDSMSAPIVMPDGQQAPPAKHSESKSTSTPPTPIVPVGGSAATGKAATTIVTPTGSTP